MAVFCASAEIVPSLQKSTRNTNNSADKNATQNRAPSAATTRLEPLLTRGLRYDGRTKHISEVMFRNDGAS